MPEDFFFETPHAVYALLLFPCALAALFCLQRYKRRMLALLGQEALFQKVRRGRLFFLFLSILFATAAWMGPAGEGRYLQGGRSLRSAERPQELLFALDASLSMSAADGFLGKSRLERAIEILDALLGRLKGQSASLTAFTSEPTLKAPPTKDYLFLRLMAREVSINEGGLPGTDLAALLKAVPREPNKQRALILLSDGGDTAFEAEGERRLKELKEAISFEAPIVAIGLGSEEGAEITLSEAGRQTRRRTSLLEAPLRELAQETKGLYLKASSEPAEALAERVVSFLENLPKWSKIASEKSGGEPTFVYDRYFQLPLAAAILFFLLALSGGKKLSLALSLSLFCLPWQALPETPSEAYRRAQALAEAGRPFEAEALADYLLSEELEPWQRALFKYQKARFNLLQGKEKEAVSLFYEIASQEGPSPLLLAKLYRDLAAALLTNARSESDFDEVLEAVRESKRLDCLIGELQGDPGCKTSRALKKLEEAALKGKASERGEGGLSAQEKIPPLKLLEEALLYQIRSRELVRRYAGQEEGSKGLLEEAEREAERALLKAGEFVPAVLKWQKEQGPICFEDPWEKALPLFFRGQREAERAKKLIGRLEKRDPLLRASQRRAVNFWRESADLLRDPKLGERRQEPLRREAPFKQRLIEMHLQDLEEREPLPLKEVERPW